MRKTTFCLESNDGFCKCSQARAKELLKLWNRVRCNSFFKEKKATTQFRLTRFKHLLSWQERFEESWGAVPTEVVKVRANVID